MSWHQTIGGALPINPPDQISTEIKLTKSVFVRMRPPSNGPYFLCCHQDFRFNEAGATTPRRLWMSFEMPIKPLVEPVDAAAQILP